MADWMDKQSSLMRERALKMEAYQKRQDEAQALLDYLKGTPFTVIKQLKKGMNLDEAIKETASITDCPIPTIEHYWKKFCTSTGLRERTARNSLVFILAAMGCSNADIGLKVVRL